MYLSGQMMVPFDHGLKEFVDGGDVRKISRVSMRISSVLLPHAASIRRAVRDGMDSGGGGTKASGIDKVSEDKQKKKKKNTRFAVRQWVEGERGRAERKKEEEGPKQSPPTKWQLLGMHEPGGCDRPHLRLNSCSSRPRKTSMCSIPRNPRRNPAPSAALVYFPDRHARIVQDRASPAPTSRCS
jgi:hypothetical protein